MQRSPKPANAHAYNAMEAAKQLSPLHGNLALPQKNIRQPKYHHMTESQQDLVEAIAANLITEAQQKEVQQMIAIFNAIDTNKSGRITADEFRAYVNEHPKGWPLVDLFKAKTMTNEERDVLVTFWFRKLDNDSDGSVSIDEFVDMFLALHNTKTCENIYVEFLINLYDDNLDGKIDKSEFIKMMRVLFGEKPPAAVVAQVPEEGVDREGLGHILRSVAMEHSLLPEKTFHQKGGSGGGSANTTGTKKIHKRHQSTSTGTIVASALISAAVTAVISLAVVSYLRKTNRL